MEPVGALRIDACEWTAEALAVLDQLNPHLMWGSMLRAKDFARPGHVLFRVQDDAGLIGYYVLRADQWSGGVEGVIVAAVSVRGGLDVVDCVLPHIERQFIDVHSITCYTRRPGLVRKLQRAGYRRAGFVMVKDARAHRMH